MQRFEKFLTLGPGLSLDCGREVLIKDNLPIALSRIEFRILYCLAQKLGEPMSSKAVTSFAWGSDAFISRNDLYVYINRLRQKLEDNPAKPACLLSLRGVGYVLFARSKRN